MSSGMTKNLTNLLEQPWPPSKDVRGILQKSTSKEISEKTEQRRPSRKWPTGRLAGVAASVREARMWKRMLQLPNGNHEELSADGHCTGSNGRVPAVVEPEETGARLAGPASPKGEHVPALFPYFEQIYQGGAVKPPRLSYGVLKVAEMLNSSHLCGMPAESKRAALMMALDAGGAKMEDILQDAIVRQRVLNDYEEARQRDLQKLEAAIQVQNRAIQAETDRITSQYMARMQSNLDEVARAQDNFRVWQKRKQQEAQRIADAAALGGRRASKIAPRRGSHAPRAGPAFRISKKRERPMNNVEQDYTQPLGLDVGTSRMVVARAKDKRQEYDSQLNAFLTLPYSKLAESLLQRENVFHEVQGAEIVVAGNDAEKFAEAFHVETRRPMANGVLNPEEPHSLAVVRRIVTKLVGRAAAEGQKVFFSVPAQGEGLNGAIRYHEASIRQILTELGYEATPIEEGLAVVYGELAASNFSGVGISCGSGLCNICLAVLSVPVISFSVPKAGDFIDASAAQVTGDRANRLRISKEKGFQLNGFTGDRAHNALTVYYQEVIAKRSEEHTSELQSL